MTAIARVGIRGRAAVKVVGKLLTLPGGGETRARGLRSACSVKGVELGLKDGGSLRKEVSKAKTALVDDVLAKVSGEGRSVPNGVGHMRLMSVQRKGKKKTNPYPQPPPEARPDAESKAGVFLSS
jgi:hypothetical protein